MILINFFFIIIYQVDWKLCYIVWVGELFCFCVVYGYGIFRFSVEGKGGTISDNCRLDNNSVVCHYREE